jgi:hypothetical protein
MNSVIKTDVTEKIMQRTVLNSPNLKSVFINFCLDKEGGYNLMNAAVKYKTINHVT